MNLEDTLSFTGSITFSFHTRRQLDSMYEMHSELMIVMLIVGAECYSASLQLFMTNSYFCAMALYYD